MDVGAALRRSDPLQGVSDERTITIHSCYPCGIHKGFPPFPRRRLALLRAEADSDRLTKEDTAGVLALVRRVLSPNLEEPIDPFKTSSYAPHSGVFP